MPQEHHTVGIVLTRRTLGGPWGGVSWRVAAVLPQAPGVEPWTMLHEDGPEAQFYAGPLGLTFHSGDAAHYVDNLASGEPMLWVALHPAPGDRMEPVLVTADPYEGEGLTEGVGDLLEAAPMPSSIAESLTTFAQAHYVERPFYKRKRDKVDPRGRGRMRPGEGGEDA